MAQGPIYIELLALQLAMAALEHEDVDTKCLPSSKPSASHEPSSISLDLFARSSFPFGITAYSCMSPWVWLAGLPWKA